MRGNSTKRTWLAIGLFILALFIIASMIAVDGTVKPEVARAYQTPFESPPFGRDERGIPLTQYAMQGAAIVAIPSVVAGVVVMLMATFAGLVRCAGVGWFDQALQVFTEFVGALPRLVVVLVVALLVPAEHKGLLPIAVLWALLASPGAMDEAAATAGRLGGERFVEALRAHGFSAIRIYLYHVIFLNLRPVLMRQGAEVMMQVVFLEIALSYLAVSQREPSFTHGDDVSSWATLLYQGYSWLLGEPLAHSMVLGLALLGVVALMTTSFRISARSR